MDTKYKTLAELKEACDQARSAGQEVPVLFLDNDTTSAYTGDDDEGNLECVFGMHPVRLLDEALDLLGIPHEGL